MPQATFNRAWITPGGNLACASVQVQESIDESVEYTGCVVNDAAFKALTNADKRQALIDAVKDVRQQQKIGTTEIPVGSTPFPVP